MTAPKLAISRPAALTGTIGQGGLNRVHDVALVQALLGAKRAKSGRPFGPGGSNLTSTGARAGAPEKEGKASPGPAPAVGAVRHFGG